MESLEQNLKITVLHKISHPQQHSPSVGTAMDICRKLKNATETTTINFFYYA